jgi:transcription elongation factor Elf1
MTKKQKATKEYISKRDDFTCLFCGKRAVDGCLAHRIAQTKGNRLKLGSDIIDHPYNAVWSCTNNICNDSFNIGFRPRKIIVLIDLIHSGNNYSSDEITTILKGE